MYYIEIGSTCDHELGRLDRTHCTDAFPLVSGFYFKISLYIIIESVDSISRDERGFPLTQYITNGGISRAILGTLSRLLNTTIMFYS